MRLDDKDYKTIGLRISAETLKLIQDKAKTKLSGFQEKYGLDVAETSNLLRLGIINLLANPPDSSKADFVIGCKDDDTLDKLIRTL